jgi:hypothetical protein
MTGLVVQGAGLLAAFVFCLVRAVIDLRARRFFWGAASAAIAALLLWGLVAPIPTHAVKVDLPVNS